MDLRAESELHEHLESLAGPLQWYIARTQPNQDRIAQDALRRRQYRVYRPVIPVRILRRGTLATQWRSMFPGYLFVLPESKGWESLRTAPGMIYGDQALLRFNGRMVTIRGDDPDFIRIQKVAQELSIAKLVEKNGSQFKIGEQVRATDGPFLNFHGPIDALDDAGRICVLMEWLRRKVRVWFDAGQLSPA